MAKVRLVSLLFSSLIDCCVSAVVAGRPDAARTLALRGKLGGLGLLAGGLVTSPSPSLVVILTG